MKKTLTTIALIAITAASTVAQEKTTFEPKVTADLVSNYIWRGVKSSGTPNFQPTLAVVKGGFEAGVWASTDFVGGYLEVDPYLAYTIDSKFKIMFTDYNWNLIPGQISYKNYFEFDKDLTGHVVEASVGFLGTEKLPLSVMVNTFIYGADKKASDPTENQYSTYIECNYNFKKWTLIAAFTPTDGYYGDGYGAYEGFSVCNIGASATRKIKLSDDFELPLKSTLIINPQAEDIFLVFGFTF